MLSDDLDNLIDSARLLGRAEARKETGCYTPDDSRFCVAMYESISKYRRAVEAAVLAEQAKAGPVAWMRKWHADGEKHKKVKRDNGRLAWETKFKFLPVTTNKCLPDDLPLHLHPAPAPEGMVMVPRERGYDERVKAIIAFNQCSGDLDDKLEAAHLAVIAAAEKEQSK